MRRIHKITGRCDDVIILRGVNLFPTQIEEIILEIDTLAPQFQCILDGAGRLDALTVRIETSGATSDQQAGASALLVDQIKNRFGVSVTVDVVEPNAVERSEGKAKRLIDNRATTGTR